MVQLYHNRNVNKNSLLFKVDYTRIKFPAYDVFHQKISPKEWNKKAAIQSGNFSFQYDSRNH